MIAPVQKTLTSDDQVWIVSPQPCKVTNAPDASRPITTPMMSTGRDLLSSQAATSTKSSPARSQTELSICAPVSNMKPPPAIAGTCRQRPCVCDPQYCQTDAAML